jgi:hypothetical protein
MKPTTKPTLMEHIVGATVVVAIIYGCFCVHPGLAVLVILWGAMA